jgi:hypothetical protein
MPEGGIFDQICSGKIPTVKLFKKEKMDLLM